MDDEQQEGEDSMKTQKIWARIGITLELSGDEYNKLLDRMAWDKRDVLTEEEIARFLKDGKADGESYIPNVEEYERV